MKHLATYMLLVMGGNPTPTKEDVIEALAKVGIQADEERVKELIESMKNKNIDELLEAGRDKLANFSTPGKFLFRDSSRCLLKTNARALLK
jgi:ribosomal protein L12E/L44/L45/RPP1/RPP2